MSLFAITPEVLRQLLSAATRTAVESNWVVQSVPAPNQITVALHNPAAAIPYIDPTAAPYYAKGLVQFITGRLGGIEPNSGGKGSATGRVSMPIQSVATTLNADAPPTTTITFAGNLPGTPAPGDRLNVFYPQLGSFDLSVAGTVDVGEITGPVTVETGPGGEFAITSVTGPVNVQQAGGSSWAIASVGSVTENVGTLIQNTTASPGNIQPGQGQFDTQDGNNGGSFPTGGTSESVTVIPSGGYIRGLNIQGFSGETSTQATFTPGITLTVYNGSQIIYQASALASAAGGAAQIAANVTLGVETFGPNGVANNGITATLSTNTVHILSGSWAFATAVIAQNTPQSVVGVVV